MLKGEGQVADKTIMHRWHLPHYQLEDTAVSLYLLNSIVVLWKDNGHDHIASFPAQFGNET